MANDSIVRKIRYVEKKYDDLFSSEKSIVISRHIKRQIDNNVPDKYDNNCFVCTKGVTKSEIAKAEKFNLDRGDKFFEFTSRYKLDLPGYDFEDLLAMLYTKDKCLDPLPEGMEIKHPSLDELIPIEVKEYGPLWGDDFTKREISEGYKVTDYQGLYVNGELVSYCFIFKCGGYTMLDDLMTKQDKRHKGYASILLKYLCDKKTFLHASEDETPKEMYKKLGFVTVDHDYEYLKILEK